ncbi:MAG TPA: chromosome segregation protein SMC [Stellaceae bacterium]|jgi:chromosome segregation protein|nr:chromosome segregation protein SMC [Stellaceae bacterium]
MQVDRLRLAGFKSFVEPTELAIEPGLTGIVGPNGCGKSNLVEALRWVMGEGSARRLRGGEMDDVIFAGSGGRPARNLAEVALSIDNNDRDAPFAQNDSQTIEVTRRIVRGGGSTYRINGRETRARDVQLLFADAATGPHSAALVGQGRIGALIGAKATERRLLIDEAAGTAGLYARRHEAELKLQAAEDNLTRLDDVVATLAAQIETLKKQTRQAQRYRRLGEQIRRTEALLLHARWHAGETEAEAFAGELRISERDLATATESALAQDRAREAADAALPPLRLAQASAAAGLQRIAHASEALEAELARVIAARTELEHRLSQLAADLKREGEHLADADTALVRLAHESSGLEQAGKAADIARAAAMAQAQEAAAQLASAETGLQQMTEACAAGDARRTALDRQRRDLVERQSRLQARLAETERQRAPLLSAVVAPAAIAEAASAVAAASSEVEGGRDAATVAAEMLAASQKNEAAAADTAREADRVLARLRAEADALTRMLAPAGAAKAEGTSMLSQVRVAAGFEAATAALFDGELAAPLSAGPDSAAAGWTELPPLPVAALPTGARTLVGDIAGPPALTRRLAYTGLVDSETDGWRLQPELQAGQSLVDRNGRLWRWDGFVRPAPSSAATAERLRQRNRLHRLTQEIEMTAPEARRTGEAAAAARSAREAAATAERSAVASLRAAEDRLARTRTVEAELTRRGLAAETRLAGLNETIERLGAELTDLSGQAAEAGRALASLPDPALARTALDGARAQTAAARRYDAEARTALDRLAREAEMRRQRLVAIADEGIAWRKRRDGAAAQRATLDERRAALAAEDAELAGRPAAIAGETEALAHSAAVASAEEHAAGQLLANGEATARETAEAARQAAAAVAEARERRARSKARCEAATEGLARLRIEIAERLDQTPEQLRELLAESGDAGAPDDAVGDQLAGRLDRLIRERDAMGPVNLLAEQEAAEVTAQLSGLEHERADLTAAIARLRRGVVTLNQEGRRRLVAAFEQLNGHFGELFARLFGGGQAELAWAGDGDPLEAGIEIMASPPGKRLQALSLLSGGEQALTALALIFAVFLTNPAPLCVLDEVDAPLDDANVDRFCRLVADIADNTGTRFLMITHHRVTMARMDRLFGVTMAERGVSQLVSVDLARAAELRQTA